MRAQVAARAIGILIGLQASVNPIASTATFRSINPTGDLPLGELVARLREPAVRDAILTEFRAKVRPGRAGRPTRRRSSRSARSPTTSPTRRRASPRWPAARASIPRSSLYDLLLEQDGRALLYIPVLNYVDGNLDAVGEMLAHPNAVPGLSDGGAHVGTICDGSFPTTLLDALGPGPHTRREVRAAVADQPPDAGDGRDGRPARPRAARAGQAGRHQRHRRRRDERSTRRSCRSTCPPAASGCCRRWTATGTRSSPASRPTPTARRPARCPAASCEERSHEHDASRRHRTTSVAAPRSADRRRRSSPPTRTSPSRRTPTSTTSTRSSAIARRR